MGPAFAVDRGVRVKHGTLSSELVEWVSECPMVSMLEWVLAAEDFRACWIGVGAMGVVMSYADDRRGVEGDHTLPRERKGVCGVAGVVGVVGGRSAASLLEESIVLMGVVMLWLTRGDMQC
eukprot:Sspe_Gene.75552::Locus_47195_Transcript_1_1_Confidence_1.000_Length_445::g.75552::m.75552